MRWESFMQTKYLCFWSISELRVRLLPFNQFKSPIISLLTVPRRCIFYVCLAILPCLFLAPLWSPVGKGLTSWPSCIWCFLVFLSLSQMVSRVRCGTWLYRFLIFTFFLTFIYYELFDDYMIDGICAKYVYLLYYYYYHYYYYYYYYYYFKL